MIFDLFNKNVALSHLTSKWLPSRYVGRVDPGLLKTQHMFLWAEAFDWQHLI